MSYIYEHMCVCVLSSILVDLFLCAAVYKYIHILGTYSCEYMYTICLCTGTSGYVTGMCVCINIYIYIYTYIYTMQYMHMYVYAHVYVHMYVCMFVCMYVCLYMHMHTHTYILHTYIHTYTHTYINRYIHSYIISFIHLSKRCPNLYPIITQASNSILDPSTAPLI